MDTVLKRLKLEDLTEKFQTEHITPDIVCKLSVLEMEMLGINSRSDMTSLRIECTKFGGEAPKKLEGTCGASISLFHSLCFVISYKRDLQSRKYLRSLLYRRVRFTGG